MKLFAQLLGLVAFGALAVSVLAWSGLSTDSLQPASSSFLGRIAGTGNGLCCNPTGGGACVGGLGGAGCATTDYSQCDCSLHGGACWMVDEQPRLHEICTTPTNDPDGMCQRE